MKALSTLQNESFVKVVGNRVSSKMGHLLKVWFLMLQVQRQDFGEMSHEGFDFMYGSISRLMASEFVILLAGGRN